ncbi:MAG: hypothetical protein ACLR78_01560 [Roseburia sp.]
MSIEEHMQYYESQGIARKVAMKLVAKDRGVSKTRYLPLSLSLKQMTIMYQVEERFTRLCALYLFFYAGVTAQVRCGSIACMELADASNCVAVFFSIMFAKLPETAQDSLACCVFAIVTGIFWNKICVIESIVDFIINSEVFQNFCISAFFHP